MAVLHSVLRCFTPVHIEHWYDHEKHEIYFVDDIFEGLKLSHRTGSWLFRLIKFWIRCSRSWNIVNEYETTDNQASSMSHLVCRRQISEVLLLPKEYSYLEEQGVFGFFRRHIMHPLKSVLRWLTPVYVEHWHDHETESVGEDQYWESFFEYLRLSHCSSRRWLLKLAAFWIRHICRDWVVMEHFEKTDNPELRVFHLFCYRRLS